MKTKTPHLCKNNRSIGLVAIVASLAAAALPALKAEEVIFSGGSPTIPTSGTLSIATPGSTPYTYSYTNPVTGLQVQNSINMGSAVIPYMPLTLGYNYGLTVKAQGDGSVWAQLSGNNTHQLITINESTVQPTSMTLDHVVVTKGRPATAKGGGMRIIEAAEGKKMTINGDFIFLNNASTDTGGGLQTGRGTLELTGNVVFDSNVAGMNATGEIANTAGGGGISFMGSPSTADGYESLIFRKDAIFLNNLAGGNGGGIYISEGVSALKGVEFYGRAVFEGNQAGVASTSQYYGGAIGVSTTAGRSVMSFYDSASFKRNSATGSGGAIANRSGNVIFADAPGFDGAKAFVFERNVAMAMTTSAYYGGGGIYTDNNQNSVYFLAQNSTLTMRGNVSAALWTGGGSISGNNGSGGAIRTNSGVYLLKGAFAFTGNQAVGNGGAIYLHTGSISTGTTYKNDGIIFDGATDTYKYRLQVAGNASFTGNIAGSNGGAIYAFTSAASNMYFGGNTQFTNNATKGRGGAIFTGGVGTSLITLNADIGDITFTGNRQQVTFTYTGANTAFTRDDVNLITTATSGSAGYMSAVMSSGNGNDIFFNGSGAMDLNAAAGRTISFDGGVAGTTTGGNTYVVTKTGAGSVVFRNQANNLDGSAATNTTRVLGGSFVIENSSYGYGNAASTFTIENTGTFGGSGTMRDRTIALAGSTIEVGAANSSTAQKLTFSTGLTLQGGSTLRFDLLNSNGVVNTTYDNIAVTGTFTATGTNIIDLTNMGSGNYTLVAASAALSANPANFQLLSYGTALTLRNQGSAISVSGNNLVLNAVMQNLATTWTGAGGTLWQSAQGTAWSADLDTNEKYFRNGDRVHFLDAGAGTVAIAATGVTVADMTVDSASNYTFTGTGAGITTTGSVSGASVTGVTQKLTKQGAGTLTFENAANTFAGGIDIAAGTLAFNKTAQLTTSATTGITFKGDATLRANADAMTLGNSIAIAAGKNATLDLGANNLTYTGSLSAGDTASTLTKTGAGRLTLSTDNSAYTGKTTVSAGTLLLANSTAKLGGAITLSSGATLSGIGTAGTSLTANAGSTIHVGLDGATVPQTLTLGDLTMNGAKLQVNLYDHVSLSDKLALNGAWIAGTGTNILDLAVLKAGTYNLGNFGGFAAQPYVVTIAGQDQTGARQTASIADVSGNLILTTTADASRSIIWTGASGTAWNISAQSWNTGVAQQSYAGGDSVTFNDTATQRTISVEGSANVTDMRVDGAGNFTFTGGAINADAAYVMPTSSIGGTITGKLIKTGAGTLTFANSANTFRGGIDIDGGMIAFNKAAQLGTSATTGITFTNSGTLKAQAAGINLSTRIAIADNVTGAIDTNGNDMTYSGSLTAGGLASTFAKNGAGTLHLTNANAAYTGLTAVNGGALLLDSATSTLGGNITVASGATFGGAGTVNGNITAQSNSTIRVGAFGGASEQLTITTGSLTLANSTTLTGNGKLRGNLKLGTAATDKIFASIAGANQVTITGTVAGQGTLVKQDNGILTLDGASALGFAKTQVDSGILMLRNITGAAATAATHQFMLNGGWVDLSDTSYISTNPVHSSGSAANNWGGVTFTNGANAAAGGVIGSNDKITLGAGTTAFNIGSSTDASKRGIFVVIDAGTGIATLTGTNTYVGNTQVNAGTLYITSDKQLGDQTISREVILKGGALRVGGTAGSYVVSNRQLTLAQSSTVAVEAGVETTWRRLASTGTGINLNKTGDGTLIFASSGSSSSDFPRGVINLYAGTIGALETNALGWNLRSGDEADASTIFSTTINVLGANTALRTGNNVTLLNDINLGANTVKIDAQGSDTGTLEGNIIGSGGINKTGSGTIILTSWRNSANTYTGPTTVTEGILRAGSLGMFPSQSTYNIQPQGTLDFNGFPYTVRAINNKGVVSLAQSGTTSLVAGNEVTITGNYHGEAGSKLLLNWGITDGDLDFKVKSDRLNIGGTASGTTEIVLVNKGSANSTINKRGADISNLDLVTDGAQAGTVFTGTFNVNGITYKLSGDDYGDLVFNQQGVVPELEAAIGIDAQALFLGKAALDTLSHRFAALRTETDPKKKGFDLWLAGMHREDRITDTVYDGAKNTVSGAQAGIDFIDTTGSNFFVLGAYVDTMSATMKLKTNAAKSDATVLGVGIYGGMRAGPWYLEATMRTSKDTFKVSSATVGQFELPGSSFGGMIETGYIFSGSPSGWVFEPQAQLIMQRSTIDPTYDSSGLYYDIDTIQSTAGRVGVKLSKAFNFKSGKRLTAYSRASILNDFSGKGGINVNGTVIEDDLSGATGVLDAGLSMRISPKFYINADATYNYGTKYNGYSLNLGACYNW